MGSPKISFLPGGEKYTMTISNLDVFLYLYRKHYRLYMVLLGPPDEAISIYLRLIQAPTQYSYHHVSFKDLYGSSGDEVEI